MRHGDSLHNRPTTSHSAPIPYPDPDHLILPLLLSCGLWGLIGWAVWVGMVVVSTGEGVITSVSAAGDGSPE